MLTTIVDRSLSAENIKKVTAHGPMNVVLVIIYMPFEPDEKVKVMRKLPVCKQYEEGCCPYGQSGFAQGPSPCQPEISSAKIKS